MVNKLESKTQTSPEDEKLQEIFRNLYASNIKLHNAEINTESLDPTILHDKIKSSFSTKFLRQNKSWLQ